MRRRVIGTVVVLMWGLVGVFVTATAPPAAAASNLNLQAGAVSSDGAVEGLNFYPGSVTVAEGDSITWHFAAPHTVNFYTDPTADPESPGVGNGTFTGTSDPESSGVIFPAPGHDTYKLTFASGSAGNYVYFCALHPGMQGVVQVVAAGGATTAQSAADALIGSQSKADLDSGNVARSVLTPTKQAISGATQYNDFDGVGDGEAAVSQLSAVGGSGVNGTGLAIFTTPTNLHVVLTMTGMTPNSTGTPAHIHSGACGVSSPPKGASNDILFPLTDVTADANGKGTSTTDIAWSQSNGPPVIPTNGWYINVHSPSGNSTVTSCGNVNAPAGSVHRFLPTVTTISAGDTVKWTQADPREVHPIYIGPAAQEPGNPFAPPAGGTTASSPNQALNSGPMFPGSTYSVKFTKPGVYNYICTLHDVEGMVGQVVVLPTGYRLAAADGGVFDLGTSKPVGSLGGTHLNSPIVGAASTPSGDGIWMAAADGGVFAYGDAGFFGSEGGTKLNSPVVGIAAAPDGKGYWLAAADGGVFNHGSAGFFGSEGGVKLNKPVVGIAAAPDGKGYWMAATDGGVFNHGSAGFFGSEGGVKLNKPVVGIAAAADGKGYWMAASDGGVFNHGSAGFFGSEGGVKLAQPVVAIAGTPGGMGYWMVASDGGVFSHGNAPFLGSMGGTKLAKPVVALAV